MSTTNTVIDYMSEEGAKEFAKEVNSKFARKTELPENLSDLTNDMIFVGTMEAFEAAVAEGKIKEGMVVHITDDASKTYTFEIEDNCLVFSPTSQPLFEDGVLVL